MIPATLKISEKAMKYHFLPRKSMFALLKNSTRSRPLQTLLTLSFRTRSRSGRVRNLTSTRTLKNAVVRTHDAYARVLVIGSTPVVSQSSREVPLLPFRQVRDDIEPLNARCLAHRFTAEHPIKNHSRNENRGKQISKQSKTQPHRETLHRPCAKNKENDRRNDRGDVGVHNRDPGMAKALLNGRRWRLPISQLFANALKNQHIGVHAHADRQNHAGNSRQRQGCACVTEKA